MIFDTGAAAVSLSMTMASYLYENDYIKKEDIVGKGKSQTADGTIVDHVVINLRDIEISGLHIKNIKATVIAGQNAPLLLGQTAIQALGPVTIEGNKLIINNYKIKTLSEQEIDKLEKEADSFFTNGSYFASLNAYGQLREYPGLNSIGFFRLIASCIHVGQYDQALDYVSEWENGAVFAEAEAWEKSSIYGIAANACGRKKDYSSEIAYREKYIACQQIGGKHISGLDYELMADAYNNNSNFEMSIRYRIKAINQYLSVDNFSISDIYNGKVSDEGLMLLVGNSLSAYALCYSAQNDFILTEQEKYLWIGAAKCGDEIAIDWCSKHYLNYKNVNYNSEFGNLFSTY